MWRLQRSTFNAIFITCKLKLKYKAKMKQPIYLKLLLVLPALAFALASCTKKEPHIMQGVMFPTAIQMEVDDPEEGIIKVFYPDIFGQAISDSRIITPTITSTTSIVDCFSPYPGHAETDIQSDVNRKNSLTALNGTYYFTAHNERAEELSIWTEWRFDSNHEFSDDWGEFEENADNKKIKKFTYTKGNIELEFKTLQSEVPVSYFLLVMEDKYISTEKSVLVRDWEGAWIGDNQWNIQTSGSECRWSMDGFNETRFDKKKVFLAAKKNYGYPGHPMEVMLLSNPKTINIGKGAFEEDDVPPNPNPGV